MTQVLMNSVQYLLLSEKNPGRFLVIMSGDNISLNSKMGFEFFEAVGALCASSSAPCTEQLTLVIVIERCPVLKGKSFQLSSNVLKY